MGRGGTGYRLVVVARHTSTGRSHRHNFAGQHKYELHCHQRARMQGGEQRIQAGSCSGSRTLTLYCCSNSLCLYQPLLCQPSNPHLHLSPPPHLPSRLSCLSFTHAHPRNLQTQTLQRQLSPPKPPSAPAPAPTCALAWHMTYGNR